MVRRISSGEVFLFVLFICHGSKFIDGKDFLVKARLLFEKDRASKLKPYQYCYNQKQEIVPKWRQEKESCPLDALCNAYKIWFLISFHLSNSTDPIMLTILYKSSSISFVSLGKIRRFQRFLPKLCRLNIQSLCKRLCMHWLPNWSGFNILFPMPLLYQGV